MEETTNRQEGTEQNEKTVSKETDDTKDTAIRDTETSDAVAKNTDTNDAAKTNTEREEIPKNSSKGKIKEKKVTETTEINREKKSKIKKRTKVMLVLSVISLILTIVLGVAISFMADSGVIGSYGREVMLEKQNELLMDRYSIWALSDADRNYNMDSIKKTNLHLGVIVSKEPNIETADMADLDNYTVQNFDDKFDINQAHIFQTYIDKGTSFGYDMSNIWGYARIWHDWEETVTYEEIPLQAFYYDWMTNKLYIEAGGCLYPYDGIYGVSDEDELTYDSTQGLKPYMNGKTHDEWNEPYLLVELPDYMYQIQLGEIQIIDDFELNEKEVSKDSITNIDAGCISVRKSEQIDNEKTYYYVVTYLNDPLLPNGESLWNNKDLFLQMDAVYNFLYDWKYVLIALFTISVTVLCICACYWCVRAFVFAWHMFGRILLMWKLALILIVGFWMLMVLVLSGKGGAALLMLFYTFVFCPFILYIGWEYRKQTKVCSELAKGNVDAKVDTKHMIWDLKTQGENINAIADSINLAVEERMKSERMKAELITNVSHDIKTPLTSIINYVDLLSKEEIESEKAKEYIEVLSRQSDKLKRLIVDLIEASKASTGNLEIHAEEIDVRMALLQVTGEYEEKLQQAGVELLLHIPEEGIMIQADGRYLFRIFDNLMTNIKKYSLNHTRAYIDLKTEGQDVLIIFKNISKDVLNVSGEEFTERFYRGDASRNTEGNGLGLAIVKSLVELMNGSIRVIVDGDLFKVEIRFPKIS